MKNPSNKITRHSVLKKCSASGAGVALFLAWFATADAQPTSGVWLSMQRGSSNTLSLMVPTVAGSTSFLEATDNLLAPDWQATHVIQGTGEVQTVSLSPGSERQRFFRLAGPRKSSLDLINEALQRGEITTETALVYRVYVLFRDDRLPRAYKGDDSGLGHFPALKEAAEAFPALSIDAQNRLQPFFVPPAYVGSWADRYQTDTVSRAPFGAQPADLPPDTYHAGWANESGTHVRIWYRTLAPGKLDPQAARQAVTDSEYIWARLTSLFGREPIADQAKIRNGGDGRLDIYVFENPSSALFDATDPGRVTLGLTVPWPCTSASGCGTVGPRYIMIRTTYLDRCLTLTHEICHAFLAAFPLQGDKVEPYNWLDEATAAWASDFVYPKDNCEHVFAPEFLENIDEATGSRRVEFPLDSDTPLAVAYGHYVFPFYVAHAGGGSAAIARIWMNCATMKPLDAINSALLPNGGLDTIWPKFALDNWNTPPVNDYDTWDGLRTRACSRAAHTSQGSSPKGLVSDGEFAAVTLQGQPEIIFDLDTPVAYMAAQYYRFVFQDPNARSVAFYNPFADPNAVPNPHVAVQAVYKVAGQVPKVENWTHIVQRNFCRDLKEERLEELVVIISNSDFLNKQPLPADKIPKLMANNIGCYQWVGEAQAANQVITPYSEAGGTYVLHQVTMESAGKSSSDSVSRAYRPVNAGNFDFSFSVHTGNCTCDWGPVSLPSGPSSLSGGVTIDNFFIRGVQYPPQWQLGPSHKPRACFGGITASYAAFRGTGCGGSCGLQSPGNTYNLPPDPTVSLTVKDDGTIVSDQVLSQPYGTATQHVSLNSAPE